MKILRFLLILALSVCGLSAQQDDFNDGNDDGWTRIDPLGGLGAGPVVTFSVIDGEYRIGSTVSPNPAAAGPARGGALRQDSVYKDSFYLSVDITAMDTTLEQAVGLLAFIQPNPSIGTTDGYALTYQPVSNDLQISIITNEVPAGQDEDLPAPLESGKTYRLVFWGVNGSMEGRMYDLDDLATPLMVTTLFDTTYSSGTCGLLVSDNSSSENGRADATFDNYVANDGTLPDLELVVDDDGEYRVQYPDWLVNASLQTSPSLKAGSWSDIPFNLLTRADGRIFRLDEFVVAPAAYYRLKR